MMTKYFSRIAILGGLALGACSLSVKAASTADVVFVIDESGSMSGEHAWIASMVTALDSALAAANVTGNRYALVGFGGLDVSGQVPHQHSVGGGQWGSASDLSSAAGGLVASGGTEDGWSAIDFALNNYTFRNNAAVNFILITDEDRDNQNLSVSYASVLSGLEAEGALLNAVVNGSFKDASNNTAVGHDGTNAYLADGSGGYTVATQGSASGAGTTIADYYNMAIATGGAAWDLNQLRSGGNTAISFTEAFVDIKVQEVVAQPTPEGGVTFAFLLCAMGGLFGVSRRMKA